MNKRLIALVLAALMVLTAVPALAEEAASWLTDTTPVTLKVFYDRPVDASILADAWGNEPVSKVWIEETGVNIQWEYAPDDTHALINQRLAGEEYPDILICFTSYDQLQNLASHGIICKLNELEETAAPGFIERNMSQNTILAIRETFATMDIYGLITGSWKVEEMNNDENIGCMTGAMVLKSVYEAIGSPEATTMDAFLDMLREVKAAYPDIIPFQASRNPGKDSDGNPRCIYKLFGFFDIPASGYFYDEADGMYKKYMYSDNFYTLLEFVNTLYNEGLMDPTELTDSGAQMQQKLFNGRIFCNMNNDADNTDWFNDELAKAGIEDEWIFIDQPSINEEEGYTFDNLGTGVGTLCCVVFDNENSERSLQWLDYVMSQKPQLQINNGVYQLTWDFDENGVPTLYPEYEALSQTELKQLWGVNLYYFLRQQDILEVLKTKYGGTEKQTANIEHMAQYYKDYSFFNNQKAENYAADSEEIKIKANIREYWEPMILELITCAPEELPAKFEEAIAKIEELGQTTLNEHINDYFQNKTAVYEKYGADLDLSYLGL
ncbi:MAG: extracellular solute-binding protein [Clostridia bacterium]|nr:extracellular solute-binding protein [Clostridia bacterium]